MKKETFKGGMAAVSLVAAMGGGAEPGFSGEIFPVSEEQVQRNSWNVKDTEECPVSYKDLRLLQVDHWGFDTKKHKGELIVHKDMAEKLVGVMHTLYDARFPIEKMNLVERYKGSDFDSIEDNNTSAFNCRFVDDGKNTSTKWSKHAYGKAIDINPIQNPYVEGEKKVFHTKSERYVDRSQRVHGMIHAGDVVFDAFAKIGWEWGGNWKPDRDYQHFNAK